MTPLFSKVDSNKLWLDVQHEKYVIYAQFGKDLFNISKVIGRKKWPSFLTHSVVYKGTYNRCVKKLIKNSQPFGKISENRKEGFF